MEGDADGAFAHAQTQRDFGGAMSLQGDLLDDATLALGQAGQQRSESTVASASTATATCSA